MKPAPFEYYAPAGRAEALALLAEHGGEAKILAGGQSLVPTMNFRLAQPAILVDLNGVADLFGIRAGAVAASRLVFLSISDVPLAAPSVTAALQGQVPTASAIADAVAALDADIDPNADIHATVAYRRHLAHVLARKTLTLAAQRAAQAI